MRGEVEAEAVLRVGEAGEDLRDGEALGHRERALLDRRRPGLEDVDHVADRAVVAQLVGAGLERAAAVDAQVPVPHEARWR